MYSVKPIGINLKDNDRDAPDGSLQESINMQWRDGAFKPIPERIISEIDAYGYVNIIFHKVSDENTINVLGFNKGYVSNAFLAFNLGGYLGGTNSSDGTLEWFGTITDGVFTTKPTVQIPFILTNGMSFTILNGLIYFMGDGSSPEERYYLKLEFNEAKQEYTIYDMYAWKSLIPFYPTQGNVKLIADKKTYALSTQCGILLHRFTIVLKTGEEVLHSPIYASYIYGFNRSESNIENVGATITNIHSMINLDLSFLNNTLFEQEVSCINVYAAVPFYKSEIPKGAKPIYATPNRGILFLANGNTLKGEAQKMAEMPFYLVKTIEKTTNERLLLTVGPMDTDITFQKTVSIPEDPVIVYTAVDIKTIAAGSVMPVDNFSYHKVYGKIGSYNGRLLVKRPTTVLSDGHLRSISITNNPSKVAARVNSDDGIVMIGNTINDNTHTIDKSMQTVFVSAAYQTLCRGIMSYPDIGASNAGFGDYSNGIRLFKLRKNKIHNMACAFNFSLGGTNTISINNNGNYIEFTSRYYCTIAYPEYDELYTNTNPEEKIFYSSDNRLQFAQAGEFKVWPAINSYRVGEGRVMNIGTGSVNPSESQVISPIIVGTSDGIYTVNLDPMGNNFIASITKTKNIPMISEEILEIDQNILFVSDLGLMVFSNGDIQNLTAAFFPQQGNGNFLEQETIYPDYDILTSEFFGNSGNPYELDDIVTYMKGALLAFDGRRNNVWCSNPAYNFSLIYSLETQQWSMSTLVFNEKQELFSIINTSNAEIYSRFMVKSPSTHNLLILSGEDSTKGVYYHILTRPIKFGNTDDYKVLPRMVSRSLLVREDTIGYISLGLWGQQEVNMYKKSIPLAIKKDSRNITFPDGKRYHIPVDCRKGKYKTITVLQAGYALPESYISSFDFDIFLVDNTKMR